MTEAGSTRCKQHARSVMHCTRVISCILPLSLTVACSSGVGSVPADSSSATSGLISRGPQTSHGSDGGLVELTVADRNGQKDVTLGDVVTVRLPETPTTGFRWIPDV